MLVKSFRTKITLLLILSMLFIGSVSNFFIYQYALSMQLNQLRDKLITLARTSSLFIDPDLVSKVPLNKKGIESPQFITIVEQLLKIRNANPSVLYIYIMGKTKKEGVLRFIVDPEPEETEEGSSSYPGAEYDASKYPMMLKGFDVPSADRKPLKDAWGVTLSGYAPIRDTKGEVIAILGVDMDASDVYKMQQQVKIRAVSVLALGVLLSIVLGMIISARVAEPIRKLVVGTRHIAKGDLEYDVEVKGDDEIAELTRSFNKMSTDLAVHIEKLKRTTAEKERLLKELEIAKGIQESFLPDMAPKLKGFDIAATSLPARMVGGDFYDFIPIDKDKWGLVVADVSGKGIPAALFMALSRTLIRATTKGKSSLKESIKQANQLIVEDSKTNMFVTLFYAVLDSVKMNLQYVNAGHTPSLLLKEDRGDIVLLEALGIPLGLFADSDILSGEIAMKKGDTIVLYTDGVTEAFNDKREQFEIARLANVIKQNSRLSASEIIKTIQQELKDFVGDQPQFDDITLMVIKAVG